MKKTVLLLFAVLSFYQAFAAEVDKTSKISNPGFENDLTGWTVQNGSDGSNTITPVIATDKQKTGSKSIKFPTAYGNQIATEPRVSQTITGLEPGNYILRAYITGKRWEKANGIFANGGTGEVKEATDFDNPNISTSWNLVSLPFTVSDAGTAVIGGYAASRRTASNRANDFWIDDFQLIQVVDDISGGTTDCSVTLLQKNLVTRDNSANGFGADAFTSTGTDGGSNLEADQDNPNKTGINTTNKCLLNKGSGINWYSYGKISGSAVTVTDTYRYLHVMVKAGKSGDSGHEYTNSGDAMLLIRTGSADSPSNYQGDDKVTDIRIPLSANAWTDTVIDLVSRGITQVYGFYFADQNWTNNHQREIYWDEIVLNNKPCSTNGNTDTGSSDDDDDDEEPANATVLANFETGGVSPSFSDNGGCVSNSAVVTNNSDNTCLNTTAKTIYAKTSTSSQDWWKGIEIDIQDFAVSTASPHYLHILIKTDIPKFEWDVHTNGDNWVGSSTTHAKDNTWFDYVLDLTALKQGTGSQFSLNGQTVTVLRIAFSCNETASRNKDIYIDEIIISDDATPRVIADCDETVTPTGTPNTINLSTKYQTIEGFGASDCWAGDFVGRYFSPTHKGQVAKWLFSQNLGTGDPEGIGLSLWRVNLGAGSLEQGTASNIGNNDENKVYRRAGNFLTTYNDATYSSSSALDFTKQEGQRYFMEQAKNYGCESFLLFSNSPLVGFTNNGKSYSASSNTANLASDKYDDFANYMADVAEHFIGEGYPVKYISPVNEPQWKWDDAAEQEGSPWTNAQIHNLAVELNSAIDTRISGADEDKPKILIAEASYYKHLYTSTSDESNNNVAQNQIDAFFKSTNATTYVGNLKYIAPVIAGHAYFSNENNSTISNLRTAVKSKANEYGIKFHQTEWCMLSGTMPDNFASSYAAASTTDIALQLGRLVYADLALADATSWSYWTAMDNIRWDQKTRFSLIALQSEDNNYTQPTNDGNVYATKNLWALGNYSLFVRPDYQRIQLTGANNLAGLMGTAYVSPDNKKIVAVYVNMGNSDSDVSITVDNQVASLTLTSVNKYVTSSTSNLKKTSQILSSTGVQTVTIPSRSVTTVVYDYSETQTITDVNSVENLVQIQIYPNPVRAGENVYISSKENSDNYKVSIYTTSGQLILNQVNCTNGSILIPQNLPQGVYLMSINGKQSTIRKTIIVK